VRRAPEECKMPPKTQPKQTSFDALVAEARDRPSIYPKLEFGDKSAEGDWDIEFLEDSPREFVYDDKFSGGLSQAFAINVLHNGEYRSIISKAAPNVSLTMALAKLASDCGGKLRGVRARIQKRCYEHKQFGPTSGYTIVPLAAVESGAHPTDVPA
jgi:hypothetical protein